MFTFFEQGKISLFGPQKGLKNGYSDLFSGQIKQVVYSLYKKVLFEKHTSQVHEWKLNAPKALNSVDTEMCNLMMLCTIINFSSQF